MILQNESEYHKSGILLWHERGYRGKGATVVILDDRSIPHDFINAEVYGNKRNEEIDHNTNVCSVIREAAPEARIVSLNWFGEKEFCLEWIKEHKNEIDVINCSFSSNYTSLKEFEEVIRILNIPVICSSGNDGSKVWVSYPAKLAWTIAVGAFEELSNDLADYSNWGQMLDAVAYTDIYIPNSKQKPMRFSGTSCAAPMTSAMLAIYIGWRKEQGLPKLTADQARKFIRDNAKDLLEEGWDKMSGCGLVTLPSTFDPLPSDSRQPKLPDPIFTPTDPPGKGGDIVQEKKSDKFTDIQGHWAESAIRLVVDDLGEMAGTSESTFEPDKPLTRAEYAVLRARKHNNS